MADSRAMEEEEERMNPINPPTQMIRAAPRYDGSGATPSMGLSQVRGGRKRKTVKADSDSDEAQEMGKHLAAHLMRLHGSGYHSKFMKGMGMSGCGESGAYEGYGNLTITHEGMGMLGQTRKVGGGNLTITHEGAGVAKALGQTRMKKLLAEQKATAVKDVLEGGAKQRKPNARAAVVKKVMADRGCSMIEASKIVKAENLY